VTYGFDADFDDVDSERVDQDINTGVRTERDGSFAPESRFLSSGVFAQDEWLLHQEWSLTLGARYGYFDFGFEDPTTGEDEDGHFDALSGSAAVAHDLTEDLRVVATLARGFRAPNLAELAREATFFGGTELPNPDLDPEHSLYEELALELSRPTWSGALAVFHDRIEDVVGSRLVDPGTPAAGDETYLRDNINELQLYGAFLRGEARLGGATSPWAGELAAEYTYGEQEDDFVDPVSGTKPFDEVPAQRIPPLHGWLGLRRDVDALHWDWARCSLNWALEQDRLSPQDLADPRIDPEGTDGWITLDLDCAGPIDRELSWTLGVHNLLDESYRVHGSGIDGPGVGLYASIQFRR